MMMLPVVPLIDGNIIAHIGRCGRTLSDKQFLEMTNGLTKPSSFLIASAVHRRLQKATRESEQKCRINNKSKVLSFRKP